MQRRYSPAVQEDMDRRARIRQRIAELYEAGKKDIQIAAALDLTESQVRHYRTRMGLRSKLRGYLSSAEIAEREEAAIDEANIERRALIYSLASEGIKVEFIAERAGVSVRSVRAYLSQKIAKEWLSPRAQKSQKRASRTEANVMPGSRRGKIRRMIGEY